MRRAAKIALWVAASPFIAAMIVGMFAIAFVGGACLVATIVLGAVWLVTWAYASMGVLGVILALVGLGLAAYATCRPSWRDYC